MLRNVLAVVFSFLLWASAQAQVLSGPQTTAPFFALNGASQTGMLNILVPNTAPPVGPSWDNHWFLIGGASSSTSSNLGFTFDRTVNTATIASLTPGTAWNKLNIIANPINILSAGVYYGFQQDLVGNVIVTGNSATSGSTATSPFTVINAESHAITTISAASATMDATMHNIAANATANAQTFTLPACAAASKGRAYGWKKIDSSANTVTISRAGTDTIDGAATVVLSTQYSQVNMQCDGAGNWWRGFY